MAPEPCLTNFNRISLIILILNLRLLGKNEIKPEELPAEEDIQKLERRLKFVDKEIVKKNLKGNFPE